MGLDLEYLDGQTPLEEEEKDDLLIPSISTREELDEFEQQNIEQAIQWTLMQSLKPETIFTPHFIQRLHHRMFGDVWRWAGKFRKTNKNIGVDKWQIPTELKNLLDDAIYWHKNNTYTPDEMAIRFKHRIVSIHCFPNGNGRHSRLIADLIIEKIYRQSVFSWGAANFSSSGDSRKNYIKALKSADQRDFNGLLAFARS